MTRFLSQKLRFYSFICISLLLFVHGYNLNETYLQPFSLVNEPTTFTTFFEYFIANGVLRFRIPLLFIISGYIFSLQDSRPYLGRIKKRFHSLIVPFLIWSAIGLLVTFALQQNPFTAKIVYDAQLDQLGDNRPYTQFGFWDMITRWLLTPVSFQLWFIRSLFIYNLLYPVLKKLVLKYPLVWFAIMFVLMVIKAGFFFIEAQGMFFFTLGVWLSKSRFPVDRVPEWFSHYLSWLFFLGLAFIKTWMAFEFEELNFTVALCMSLLHYVSVIAGVMAVWYSGDQLVAWCMKRKWFVWLTSFSFIIYAMHVPILPYMTRLFYMYLDQFQYYRLATFFIVPFLVFILCVLAGVLWKKLSPKTYGIATGGRGF